jgi:uncharacterized protein YegL
MSRHIGIQKPVLVSLTVAYLAAAWWGCSAAPSSEATVSSTSVSASSGSGGSGSTGTGGIDVDVDGGTGDDDSGVCTSTSAEAKRVQLDIVFLIDRSGSMTGAKWKGTVAGLTEFWNDPASAKIGAGVVYFPNWKAYSCAPEDYQGLNVPIDLLPDHAFALTNSLPADATGSGTPTFGALQGALLAATAYQDAHPTHKVILVLATDGDPTACGDTTIDDIASLAKGARNYNGVLTYVIGVSGSTIANLNKIAVAGGTGATYDITNDISQFSSKMEEIRGAALGCEFELPPPPNGEELDKDKVNFSYTPKGTGMPKILLRANDLADCGDTPGWYYDSYITPTKLILCPASCATVQADTKAKVEALFGCKTLIK